MVDPLRRFVTRKDLRPGYCRPVHTGSQGRRRDFPALGPATMGRGTRGSRRNHAGAKARRPRDATQVGDHQLCTQPVLKIGDYRTGSRHETRQLPPSINPLPRVHVHHRRRWPDGNPEALPAGEPLPAPLTGPRIHRSGAKCRVGLRDVGTALRAREDASQETLFIA